MTINDSLKQLDKLNLPKEQYVIVGSGALGARGIRESHDLDILVTKELWQKLRLTYELTKIKPVENIDIGDIQILGHGSMFRSLDIASVEEIIKTADIIFDHKFINLNLLKKFKQKEGREKDINDVGLIDKYLSNNIK
jgi:hypothetical protein